MLRKRGERYKKVFFPKKTKQKSKKMLCFAEVFLKKTFTNPLLAYLRGVISDFCRIDCNLNNFCVKSFSTYLTLKIQQTP